MIEKFINNAMTCKTIYNKKNHIIQDEGSKGIWKSGGEPIKKLLGMNKNIPFLR